MPKRAEDAMYGTSGVNGKAMYKEYIVQIHIVYIFDIHIIYSLFMWKDLFLVYMFLLVMKC